MWRMLSAVVASSAVLVAMPAATAARPPDLPDLVPKLKITGVSQDGLCKLNVTLTVENKARADAGPYLAYLAFARDGIPSVSFVLNFDGTPAHGTSVFAWNGVGPGGPETTTYQFFANVNEFDPNRIPESDFTNDWTSTKEFACPRHAGTTRR